MLNHFLERSDYNTVIGVQYTRLIGQNQRAFCKEKY